MPNIPHLLPSSSPAQQIRQIAPCGNTMYGVGTFTTVRKGSTSYSRSTGTGAVVTACGHSASGQVNTLRGAAGHILAGGYYTSINNSTANHYMTSLNPVSGKDDGFLGLNISGNYNFPGAASNPTRVYNQALSHSGQYDLVMGDFTTAGGLPRQQIFMLNLRTTHAAVTGWTSPEWDGSLGELSSSNPAGYPYQCATVEPYYLQAAAWSPDDATIYIGTTGYHPNGFPTGSAPRTGLCDAAAAFPATVNPAPRGSQPGMRRVNGLAGLCLLPYPSQ